MIGAAINGLMAGLQTGFAALLAALGYGPLRNGLLGLAMAGVAVSAFFLWRLSQIEERQQRLNEVVGGLGAAPAEAAARAERRAARRRWPQRLGALVAKTPAVGENARAQHRDSLARAGFRSPGHLSTLHAAKLVAAICGAVLLWEAFDVLPVADRLMVLRYPCLLLGVMLGWVVPDIVLARLGARRRKRVEVAMPDALDLLVICAQAGLSLSQAIEEVGRDLANLSPELSDEFELTAAEMRVMTDRAAALENLGRRTGLPSLRGLIATLNQSIKFGTPLSEALRVFAAEMRNTRVALLEERAARLPVMLALPLIGMIMPALLILIGTPIGLRMLDSVRSVFPQLF